MRLLFLLLVLLPCFAKAQTKYVAAYEVKSFLDLSNLEIKQPVKLQLNTSDSSSSTAADSALKELFEGGLLKKMLQEELSGALTIYQKVFADSLTAELEGYTGGKIEIRTKKKFENGVWKSSSKQDEEERQSTYHIRDFIETGQTKELFGYTCYEAKDTSGKVVVWFCKDLPASISPGFRIAGADWAIFEFSNKDHLQIGLKSFKVIRELLR